jgi:translocation and assembly module TamA
VEGLDGDRKTKAYVEAVASVRRGETDGGEAAEEKAQDALKAMRARGYYDASVRYEPTPRTPYAGTYHVAPGTIYRIGAVAVDPPEHAAALRELPAKPGLPLRAETVLESERRLLAHVGRGRCLFKPTVKHEAVLRQEGLQADILFRVRSGGEARFGPVRFVGNKTVKEAYLRQLPPWKEGACFREEDVEKFRTLLLESGLFSRADALLPERTDADGRVPISVALTERAPRTVQAGLEYYTDEGASATFGWRHRNLFGGAEALDVDLGVGELRQFLEATFSKPSFLRKDQLLALSALPERQDTDAFEAQGGRFGAELRRKIGSHVSAAAGVDLAYESVKDKAGTAQEFVLSSVPVRVDDDDRDDRLNPSKGRALSASVAPFFDLLGESSPFVKIKLAGSAYFAFDKERKTIFAVRGAWGNILGAETGDVPASERFYAGGGGSVRGFGYQEIGPDKNGVPAGGRSLLEQSSELRRMVTDKIGMAAFADIGGVSDEPGGFPEELAVGAGVGIRYYSGFGPFRLDVAVPAVGREKASAMYQLYISIGQAF